MTQPRQSESVLHELDFRQEAILSHGTHARPVDAVLFLLEFARTSGDVAFLELAKSGAKHLAETWESSAASDPSFIHNLSRTAFALAEAWKITQNPVYRDAGLSIIRYLAEVQSGCSETGSHVGVRS